MAIGAEPQGVLIQRDTYFRARQGRLKLREEEGAQAHLIAYERPDRSEQRQSRYRIVPVDNAEEMKALLEVTIGIEVVVAKERRLFIWKGVRIHLDRVDQLGHFIEFEAPTGSKGSDFASAAGLVESLRGALEIDGDDLIASSYGDLALAEADAERSEHT